MRRATGSGELRLGKVRSLWNRLGGVSNLGFAVWVVYGILYALGHWTAAVVAGLAIMMALVARETRAADVKVVDLTSLGFFVLALTAWVSVPPPRVTIRFMTLPGMTSKLTISEIPERGR
jgi:hypothetical protein